MKLKGARAPAAGAYNRDMIRFGPEDACFVAGLACLVAGIIAGIRPLLVAGAVMIGVAIIVGLARFVVKHGQRQRRARSSERKDG